MCLVVRATEYFVWLRSLISPNSCLCDQSVVEGNTHVLCIVTKVYDQMLHIGANGKSLETDRRGRAKESAEDLEGSQRVRDHLVSCVSLSACDH